MHPSQPDAPLLAALDTLLDEHPAGLAEYDLMTLIDQRYGPLYPKPNLADRSCCFSTTSICATRFTFCKVIINRLVRQHS